MTGTRPSPGRSRRATDRTGAGPALPRDSFQSGLLGGPLRDPAGFGELVGGVVRGVHGGVRAASLVIPDAWLDLRIAGRYQECNIGRGFLGRLVQDESGGRCRRDSTWGTRDGVIWVTNGCSGRFEKVRIQY